MGHGGSFRHRSLGCLIHLNLPVHLQEGRIAEHPGWLEGSVCTYMCGYESCSGFCALWLAGKS